MLAVENVCSFRILLSQVRVGYLVGHSRYSVERRTGLREGSKRRSNAARIWYTAVSPPRRANLDSSNLTDDIVTVAHHCWCKRIPRQGWRPGKLLDVVARIHNAPRPYLGVGPEDQGRLRLVLTWDGCEEELVDSVGIALGNAHDTTEDRRRRAYIVSSLKHHAEVETLRMIYPQGFYLIAVHEDPEDRFTRLTKTKKVPEPQANALMDRDKDGHKRFGQRVAATFHLADFFVRVDGRPGCEIRLGNSLCRIIDLMFGHPYLTPAFDEYAMFMAFAASLRSADLSRQVGAVVTNNDQILSTGANDCPKFGGGLYWPQVNRETGQVEDFPNGRDFMRGEDSNAVARRDIMNSVIDEAKKLTTDADKLEVFTEAIEKGRIRDLTEYGRVVHAEMEAMLSCARAGVSTKAATLYGTTYPCHNCAKHIIAAGITRVVYIEPYPKSKALEFHNEALQEGFPHEGAATAKVLFEPFVGVGPRRFFDLFSISLGSGSPISRKNEESGKKVTFALEGAKLRLQMLPNSYLDVEGEATDAFERYAKQREGTPDESAANPSNERRSGPTAHH